MEHIKLIKKISVLEILDRSFSIYFENIETFFVIFLLLNVINTVLMYAIGFLIPQFSPPYESIDKFFSWLVDYGATILTIFCFSFLVNWMIMNIGNSLVIRMVSNIIFRGKKPSIRSSFTLTPNLFGRILAASFITGALMALGFILLIFPGLIMAIIFSLTVPALILENLSVFNSLRRSKELTDGVWMKVFLLLFAFLLMLVIIYSLMEVLTSSSYIFYKRFWIKKMLEIIFFSLIEPIYPISITWLYYLLKEEKTASPPIETEKKYYEPYPSPHPPPTEVKYCYYCGQFLPQDAIYCPNCGKRVKFLPE